MNAYCDLEMTQYFDYYNKFVSALKQLYSITNESEKEELRKQLINDLLTHYTRPVPYISDRFLEIDSDLDISTIPKSLISTLNEAIFCYVNGQFLSAIAVTGIAAEIFVIHLYELFLKKQGLTKSVMRERVQSFQRINQNEKIETLFCIVGHSNTMCEQLHQIRKKRNDAVHTSNQGEYQNSALECLQILIDILNEYSDEIRKQNVLMNKELVEFSFSYLHDESPLVIDVLLDGETKTYTITEKDSDKKSEYEITLVGINEEGVSMSVNGIIQRRMSLEEDYVFSSQEKGINIRLLRINRVK